MFRYFLDTTEAKTATSSLFENFSLFGSGPPSTTTNTVEQPSSSVEEKKKAAEAAAQARKEEAEAKRAAAAEAAKQRALEAQAAKEAREAAAQARKEEAEAKRAAAAEAAKQRALEAQAAKEAREAEAQKRREEAEAKRTAAAKASQAEKTLQSAKPGSTISLFGFGVSDDSSQSKLTSKAPRGVPVLSKWRQNRDGSISGFISGSPAFDDGDAVTTSPIVTGSIEGGSVVQSGSGSRFVLYLI